MHYLPGSEAVRNMGTDALRAGFLIEGLFRPGHATLRLVDLDRVVVGGIVPLATAIPLDAPAELGTSSFTERREAGILNVGGPGAVAVDGVSYAMQARDGLYVGRGGGRVSFSSASPDEPARFYLVSYPSHAVHPTRHVSARDVPALELGSTATANRRRLYKYFHPDGVTTAQLVMGVTEIESGSVWNTMPPHTHQRRTELYMYFDLPADAAVLHLMGEPQETRHLVVRDGGVVLSPGWSIHAGCGTAAYAFCWAMGGENQDFADMQGVAIADLR